MACPRHRIFSILVCEMISVRDLTKQYGSFTALQGVTFDVRPKEVVGFLGPNGAGKSTTMKILTGVLAPTSGEVRVDGMDVLEQTTEVRSRIGALPENNPLYLDMRVESFLQWAGTMRGMSRDALRARIPKVLAATGTEEVRRRYIGTLSKGFRQRTGLAQALLADPEILILDEPTVGLDPKQIIEIRELIRKVGREKTVILCSHILPEVQATCSRIIIISKGRIVASGSPDELAAQTGSASSYTVTIRGPEHAVRTALAALPGVSSVDVLERPEHAVRLRVVAAADADPRDDIFRATKDGGWALLELAEHQANLEDVFLNLTTKE